MRSCWHHPLLVCQVFSAAIAFQLQRDSPHRILSPRTSSKLSNPRNSFLSASGEGENDGIADNDDYEGAPSVDSEDWRAFRARLVLGNQGGGDDSWAYDSGHVIEPGSIILAKVEPDFCYFGLNQQYFHKSVMLVTYHKEGEFTKGIILNRPTNLFCSDEDFLNEDGEPFIKESDNTTENSWRMWFGGDMKGLYSDDATEIVCLHSIDTDLARNVSEVLMNNVMITNYQGAIQIINAQQAEPKDFWMFSGYAGWGGGQLLDELDRESWYMVAADSETVWKELIRQREENADPRDAGLKTWFSLMSLIGKEDEAKALSETFADLTLKEWAADTILFNSTAENSDMQENRSSSDIGVNQLSDILSSFSSAPDTVDKLVQLAANAKNGLAGSLLRGSADERSPFLLSEQEFHKSVLLMLEDDGQLTVGVILNHPTVKTRPMTLSNGKKVEITVRYGGSFGIPGVTDQPTIFLHAKSKLKERLIGEPVGKSETDASKIWICSEEQAAKAMADGHASHRDFMCIEGFTIWDKDVDQIEEGGILEDLLEGKFEMVDPSFTEEMWVTLLAQASLSIDTLDRNCRLASDAWGVAGKNENPSPPYVYESTVSVTELADDACRFWIEAFLLGGVVSAAEKYSAFE